jgi:hypothetical protein
MKKSILLVLIAIFGALPVIAQTRTSYQVPEMPDPAARKASMEAEWAALQVSPPKLGVRDCFMFLLDALDTRFLTAQQTEWVLKLLRTRVVTDMNVSGYGNIYWGWLEKDNDIGDGNNVQFCVQYGILIKILFEDRLSTEARKTLAEIFAYAIHGVHNQQVRISYTNIYLMKIWNLLALGQVYRQPSAAEEGRKLFDIWLNHVARFGNREYDSPTYCGVDLESLALIQKYSDDEDIKTKASDAMNFFLIDFCSHYNRRGGFLGGAHSRDYNRVFGRDLLEEKYMNPLLGGENTNTHLFHQICFSILKETGFSPQQKELMNRTGRFIVQRWDSFANSYCVDYVGNKVSIASSNQSYSPDDKSFVAYLSSKRIPAMLNIAYNMEGRNDHYGTWAAEGMGEKMKHLIPAGYPSNGGWGKARHLMYFMQAAQNKGEFVMVAAGVKDHNCIYDYLNSTIILPDAFDEIWIGNGKTAIPEMGGKVVFDETKTFFARFEDVAIAIRILWDDAGKNAGMALYNDGFMYRPTRENFKMANNKGYRLTLQHPGNGKGAIAMWWKVEEGIKGNKDFARFRQKILTAPVLVHEKEGIVDVSVSTPSGKLGVKADIINKKRLEYYNPLPLPDNFLFSVDGVEIGRPIMEKYKLNTSK